jgi:hypothetical protein
MVWEQGEPVAQQRSEPSFERANVVHWALVVLLGMAVLGLVGGVLWATWADPPGYTVSRQNASMGQAESGKQFGVEVVYAGIAAALGLVAGLVAGWRLSRYGWILAVTLTLGGLSAALISSVTGRWLGPPDPSGVLARAAVGTVVPVQLTVESTALFFTWPAAALAGLLLAVGVLTRSSAISTPDSKFGPEHAASD